MGGLNFWTNCPEVGKDLMKRFLCSEYTDLMKEWSDRNEFPPEGITTGSNRMVWWKGSCGHEWIASVKNRVKGSGCPYCKGTKILEGFNDLATIRPEISAEWSPRNGLLKPQSVTACSNKVVWWKGKCGHEWKARIADRTEGHGCSYCAGGILEGFNDLKTLHPELIVEWSERNSILPTDVSPRSHRVVWWKCRICGHEWQAQIFTKVKGTQCPMCRRQKTERHYRSTLYRRKEKRADRYGLPVMAFLFYAHQAELSPERNEAGPTGIPLQFYFPERQIAVEFSGKLNRAKQHRRQAEIQNDLCLRQRIRMVRILETDDLQYDNCLCIWREDESWEALSEAIGMLFQILGIEVDVDIERDILLIREYMIKSEITE